MIMAGKVAVVTGSNRGIGFGIVKELCKRGVGVVYLTARDTQRGLQALEKIKQEGYKPEFHQLDIGDKNSVKKFAEYLKQKHDGMDILINNAGVAPKDFYNTTYAEAKRVIEINYKTYFSIQEYIFPVLKQNARVINFASDCGHISNIRNAYWIERLIKFNMQTEDIDAFVDWFLMSIKNGSLKKEDFADNLIIDYKVSHIAICALTRIQQRDIDRNISINFIHPGFVKTDMTEYEGELTIEEASQTPVYLALDCDQSIKGRFIWFDKTERDWTDLNADLSYKNPEEVKKFFEKYKPL